MVGFLVRGEIYWRAMKWAVGCHMERICEFGKKGKVDRAVLC